MLAVQTRRRIARTLLASICAATGTELLFLSARASAAHTSDIFGSGSAYPARIYRSGTARDLTGCNPQLFVLNTSNAGLARSSSAFSISDAPDGAGGESLIISYTGAPEPGSAMLLGASAPLPLLRRRRTTKPK